MKLVIIIPSYNEEDTITEVIHRIPQFFEGVDQIIPLVVNDGSTDQTAAFAQAAGAVVVSHAHNQGVGFAFNTGLQAALELGADIMVNIDADGQFSPQEINRLIAPILAIKADFVAGDRFIDEKGHRRKPQNMPTIKYWGNLWMSRLISLLSKEYYCDVSCGFRAYSKKAMLWLNLRGKFTYTQETFLDFSDKGLDITSVPVKVKYFTDRKSKVAGNLFQYTFRTMKIIIRAYRDYNPLKFFGWLSIPPFIAGLGCSIFLLVHFIRVREFFPFKFVGFAGVYLISLALLLWIVGLLADMFMRMRANQEKLLYFEKKRRYEHKESQPEK